MVTFPTGIFYAQGVKANVLFFDRKPASEKPWTTKLWIYDFRTNEHFTLKTNPLKRNDLDDFVACYHPENRHERIETERFESFAYEDLIKRDKGEPRHRLAQRRQPGGFGQPARSRRNRRRDRRGLAGGFGSVRPDCRRDQQPKVSCLAHEAFTGSSGADAIPGSRSTTPGS